MSDPVRALQERYSHFRARLWVVAAIWAAIAPLFLFATLFSPVLVLPLYSAAAIGIAAIIALYAYLSGEVSNADRLTAWDVAGGFALIGVAAGIFSEPAHLIAFFDGGTTR